MTCYAESKNGLDWVRPNLGLHEVQGTRNNNVILTEPARKDSFAPFLDHNPGARPSERYKATASGSGSLAGYTSPDGIHWTNTYKTILRGFEFDSLNVAFWSEVENRYIYAISATGMAARRTGSVASGGRRPRISPRFGMKG